MSAAARIWPFFFLALAAAFSVAAKDLADYRVGDVAESDITTFVPLDVPDAAATAAQQAATLGKIPSVFRDFPHTATNQMTVEFFTVMSVVQGKFKAALQKEFSDAKLDASTVASPEFTNFANGFISANNRYPLNLPLAAEWARGGDGAAMTGNFLSRLLAMLRRPVSADELPTDFVVGEKFYAMSVAHPEDSPALADVEKRGHLVTAANLTKISRLRMLFRRGFPKEEQAFAATLAGFLRPVCAPDVALTEEYRRRAAKSVATVRAHFDIGQVIVARGATVDDKALAAITQLREKTSVQPTPATPVTAPVVAVNNIPPVKTPPAAAPNYLGWGASILAGIIAFFVVVRAARPRRRIPLVTQAAAASGKPIVFAEVLNDRLQIQPPASVTEILKKAPPNLAPQFVESLKEAVVIELATQRRDLLFAQQAAAAEIADLARRLENAQAPLLERLKAYEQRITELESELASQSKQNRELLQVKIDMLRQQIDSERGARPANFN